MAKFKCLNPACEATWEAAPGPQTCAKCGGIIIKWLDYDAKARIVDVLTRAKTWLTTPAIVERTRLTADHVKDRVKVLIAAGAIEQRRDPLKASGLEYRIPPSP